MPNNKNTLASDIIEGLEETINFLDGKETGGRVTYYFNNKRICIRDIRESLKMTRDQFAKSFKFTKRSIQNWECGIRRPNEHTLAYLHLISLMPDTISKELQ